MESESHLGCHLPAFSQGIACCSTWRLEVGDRLVHVVMGLGYEILREEFGRQLQHGAILGV